MNSHLKILQYNVHTSKGKVMAPLLADHHISEFTVLAIQEPWQNPHIHTTHNPYKSSFYLHYPPSANASVCFFANKLLNRSSYSAAIPTTKYGYLCLRGSVDGARDVVIHNVYSTGNLSPTSSESEHPDEPPSVDTHKILLHVSTALSDTSPYHVLLGDFNIHHCTWGGAGVRPDQSFQLHFSLQELHDLSLLLPPETITFKRHDAQSTIDLVFSSSSLSNTLTACCSREDLDHGSDHYHIESSFLFSPHTVPHVPKPLWRKAEALRSQFVPAMPNADLTDIPNASYPAIIPCPHVNI
jgi:hypothetical protein